MGFFWKLPRGMQYGLAIAASALLAMPIVCAMFLVLTFGLGALWLLAVIGIVFGAPLYLFVLGNDQANREKRARIQHVWALSLVVHIGASAGLCRVMDHMPNSPVSSEGRSFVEDYLGVLFAPVAIAWQIATHPGPDARS